MAEPVAEAAHLIAARKQRETGIARDKTPFKGMPSVTYFCQICLTSEDSITS
jgi:hypothetical protein